MLGEGMPWHIIMIFFVLGIFMGIKSGKDDDRKAAKERMKAKMLEES